MLQVKQDRSGSSRSKIHQLGRVFSQALYRVKTLHFFADIIHGWFLDGSKQATFPSSLSEAKRISAMRKICVAEKRGSFATVRVALRCAELG